MLCLMDTPSPDFKKTKLSRLTTPNVTKCKKMTNSPALVVHRKYTDFSELSMSPLQLIDSPVVHLPAPLTPNTLCGESPSRKFLIMKQTSTPSAGLGNDTPSLSDKAFLIANQTSVPSKAKRRLIQEDNSHKKATSNTSAQDSSFHGNAAKKFKTLHSTNRMHKAKKRFGQINSGVSHKIRPRDKTDKCLKSSSTISLFELKKAKTDVPRHPFDPINRSLPSSPSPPSDELRQTPQTLVVNTVAENVKPTTLPDNMSPLIKEMQRTKLSPSVPIKEKRVDVTPKVITRNWNQQYRKDNRERKFFKSRLSNDETCRVVTVSVSENLKLQVREIVRSEPSSGISPRTLSSTTSPNSTSETSDQKTVASNTNCGSATSMSFRTESHTATSSQGAITANLSTLHQDWEDDTVDSMIDLSSNIQSILDELNDDETKMPATSKKTENKAEMSGQKPVILSTNEGAISNHSKAMATCDDKEGRESRRFFPLFYKDSAKALYRESEAPKKSTQSYQWLKARNDGENQMILDAGQKAFGAVQCPECLLVYHLKDPEDELLHTRVHDSMKDTLRFSGWKKERIVRRYDDDSYVLVIHYGDPPYCWKKVHSVLKEVVDHELGFSEIGIREPQSTKVYFYITDKRIAGVLVAESVSRGYRMINSSTVLIKCCSPTPSPVCCGISRIWTLASYRRRQIATKLVDAMRSEFLYGQFLTFDEIAFSDPTENGLSFAASYTKRSDFLVYNM